jgi:hypothetical protein
MRKAIDGHPAEIEFMLIRTSAEGRRHAFQCRDLADSCLTDVGERTLREMADEYERLAGQLEEWGY